MTRGTDARWFGLRTSNPLGLSGPAVRFCLTRGATSTASKVLSSRSPRRDLSHQKVSAFRESPSSPLAARGGIDGYRETEVMTLNTFFPRRNDPVENEGLPPLASECEFSLIGLLHARGSAC